MGASEAANEAFIRKAYQMVENRDVPGWAKCFTEDGTFTDEGHVRQGGVRGARHPG